MLTPERKNELRDRYLRVCENIEAARLRRGTGIPVTLLAATKTVPEEEVAYLVRECGLRLCGENHAQEFAAKFDGVTAAGARMDFIGHLQTNKVRVVAGRAGLIHSVDSVRLAAEIDSRCRKLGVTQDILVEINIGEEESKTGVEPDRFDDFLAEIEPFSAIRAVGIMTMAPKCEKLEDFRAYFRKSYQFYLDFSAKKLHNIREPVLSMGMSDSYECAIEEGATLVRVGSAIFGARHYQ
ncbi:MAG: YggS family pyridoxal phosphate-dependent enzyme [Clostridia bacterium]|nr:YggS family pyridoxal phosphate-dependent enzyme [Clostridia bacterium]MBR4186114.1 YggS family pyridoxal phosphate-dependent enzyme [Clostridia bacterium]